MRVAPCAADDKACGQNAPDRRQPDARMGDDAVCNGLAGRLVGEGVEGEAAHDEDVEVAAGLQGHRPMEIPSLQKDPEARLLEVVVVGQDIGNLAFLHDHDRETVDPAPLLVRAVPEELNCGPNTIPGLRSISSVAVNC